MNQVRLGKRGANEIAQNGDNGDEANEDEQPPIRRSARIADRGSAMKSRPASITKTNKTTDEEIEKKKKEEAEEKRRKEEEKEIKIKIDQANFDEEAEVLYEELKGVRARTLTSEETREQLAVVRQVIIRLKDSISKAGEGVGTAMMDFPLGDALKIRRELRKTLEKLLKKEEDEAMARYTEELEEEVRKEEEEKKKKKEEEDRVKKEEERKKKEEDEGKMKEEEEERKEKNRMEASMIDKECKICFDEIKMGVGCMLCMQVLGCNTCVNEWLKTDKSCPNCRRQYTNVSKQVKKVEQMNKSSVKKTPIPPTRRSSRGHSSLSLPSLP